MDMMAPPEHYAATEFEVRPELLSKLLAAMQDSSVPFFSAKQEHADVRGGALDLQTVMRREFQSPELVKLLGRAVRYDRVDALYGYIIEVNQLVGRVFDCKHGLRDKPVMVWDQHNPWATFLAMNHNANALLKECLERLLLLSGAGKKKNFFILGLLLVLGLVHPFHDGNGRTMRFLLCKTLLELKRLPNSVAVDYTTFRHISKSAYSSAWYEVRVNEDFGPYLQMFR
jgi:hypothetical protein